MNLLNSLNSMKVPPSLGKTPLSSLTSDGLFPLPDLDSDSDSVVTLYYAELFSLVRIRIQIPVRMVSQMVTEWDRCPSQFYYISVRGSESESNQ